jgi:hypothetical protein
MLLIEQWVEDLLLLGTKMTIPSSEIGKWEVKRDRESERQEERRVPE